jgi:YbgC/YbaW family acyl-CoA thioester hydrolase
MPSFRTTRRIEFVDTDMAGIVHFSNFFRFMEAAEVSFLQVLGLSVRMEWEGQAIGFPRVAAACDFLRPVRFEDVVDIAVIVDNVGRKSVAYSFEFSHAGHAVARGKVTTCCCRVLSGHRLEAIEIPEAIRGKLLGAKGQ